MPTPANLTAPRHEYRVYVIQLDPKVLDEPRFQRANPAHDPRKVCVYVGSTGASPEERFVQHKTGYRASRYARDYGVGLLRRLMDRSQPSRTKLIAVRKEAALALRLRRAGYAVWPTEASFASEIAELEAARVQGLRDLAQRVRQHRRAQSAVKRPDAKPAATRRR
jgi:predicted GIY-YIG superfamily endonuclease